MPRTITPADVDWHLTHHLLARAAERGISENEIHAVLDDPQVTYSQNTYGLGRQIRQRGNLGVVVDTRTLAVITVLFRSPETWLRQLANQAVAS